MSRQLFDLESILQQLIVEHRKLLRHLDARLDATAQEALAKWQFTPALRNGVAVDVDAVFEIPFRLAPRPKK